MIIFRPWRSQYSARSGTRAIEPSSFITSQITPAGISPARRARSTLASVWPARSSTPPGLAFSGLTWPGWTRSSGLVSRVDRDLDRVRAVVRRDAGRDAVARLDRDRERRLQGRLVLRRHQLEAELVAALGRQRQADPAARLLGHEVDRLGRDELRGHHEVALVLAVLVVADDDHPALADLLDRLLDRRERRGRACCAHDTPSVDGACACAADQPLDVLGEDVDLDVHARAHRRRSPSVVRCSVSGISETAKPSLGQRADRQADAVERDRALLDEVAPQARLDLDLEHARDPLGADLRDGRRCRRRGPARRGRRAGRSARSGSSRLTGAPARSSPSEERVSVSAIASAAKLLVAHARSRSGRRR